MPVAEHASLIEQLDAFGERDAGAARISLFPGEPLSYRAMWVSARV